MPPVKETQTKVLLQVSTVWIVVQESFKVRPATPPVTLAPADGAILATDPLVATPYHRGRTVDGVTF